MVIDNKSLPRHRPRVLQDGGQPQPIDRRGVLLHSSWSLTRPLMGLLLLIILGLFGGWFWRLSGNLPPRVSDVQLLQSSTRAASASDIISRPVPTGPEKQGSEDVAVDALFTAAPDAKLALLPDFPELTRVEALLLSQEWVQELDARFLEPWRDGEGPMAPYLLWNEKDQVFECNGTRAQDWSRRWTASNASDNFEGLKRWLAVVEVLQVPVILHAGSLLAFLRECRLGTDDFDFLTFERFVEWWTIDLLKGTIVDGVRHEYSFGELGGAAYEMSFVAAAEGREAKVDLFIAQELPERYVRGIWRKGRPYACVLPRPPRFLSARHWSGARFFVPATALLEMHFFYGPNWEEPYTTDKHEKWHWWRSLRHFLACDTSSPIPPNGISDPGFYLEWDNIFEPLNRWRASIV